jgi:hypothetical protein
MQPSNILDRYRQLRAISARHHGAALDYVARSTVLERAKHLGRAHGQTMFAESSEAMALIFDLAVHTAKRGRSRAIDRYARTAAVSPGSDEAVMLEAICAAKFSICRIERRHEAVGLIVTDLLRHSDTWLIDEGLAASAESGIAFASRLCWPAEFAMTCGVVVPVDYGLVRQVALSGLACLQHLDSEHLLEDPRFAAAIYQAALSEGIMDTVVFQEPGVAA